MSRIIIFEMLILKKCNADFCITVSTFSAVTSAVLAPQGGVVLVAV